MPLSINTSIINKQHQKEVFDYLNRFLDDNTDTLYFYINNQNSINDLKFDGFYLKDNNQYMVFQHTNYDLQEASNFINPIMLKFIIEKTPFFTESISLCVKNINKIDTPFGFESDLVIKELPATYDLIKKHFSQDNLFFLNNILNPLYSLNQYILGSNLIFMKNT